MKMTNGQKLECRIIELFVMNRAFIFLMLEYLLTTVKRFFKKYSLFHIRAIHPTLRRANEA